MVDDTELPDETGRLGHLNLIELSRESTRWGIGGALEESDGIVLFATGTWIPVICNGAFRTDDSASPAELIARADTFFADRDRGYTVMVRDLPEDDDLRRACENAGLTAFGNPSPEMVCTGPVPETPPDGVELRTVTTVQSVADFAAVCGQAYSTYGLPVEAAAEYLSLPERLLDAPHVIAVTAYDGDDPVAGAMTILSHGIAGIYWVGTVEGARRRGLGAAVTAAVTNISFSRGARLVTLQASIMGEPVYRAMGYRPLYRYEDWVRFAAPPPTG
jgi:hypothetical protein